MRKRRRIGASLAAYLPLVLIILAYGGDKKSEEYAVVAGTVFREPGFALPSAEVTLTVKRAPQGAKVPKSQKAIANYRGEFAFRVPAVKGEYTLNVKAPGFVGQQKPVVISGGPERQDTYFELKPETK